MRIQPTLFETCPRVWKHPAKAAPASLLKARHLMGSTSRTTEDMSKAQFVGYGVETDNINTAPGIELSESQKLLTGSVLDVGLAPSCLDPFLMVLCSSSQAAPVSRNSRSGLTTQRSLTP